MLGWGGMGWDGVRQGGMGGFLVLEMRGAKKTDFPKKLDVLIRQVTNRIHYPDRKIH